MKTLNQKTILVLGLITTIICIAGLWGLTKIQAAIQDQTQKNWMQTDITQYSEIRGQSHSVPLFGHFPPEIPPNATDVQMLYSPPFLQKGLLFQLWLTLPEDEIKALQVKYKEAAAHKNEEPAYLFRSYPALLRYHTSDNCEGEVIPKEYEVIVLGADSKDEGNHGHTYGVAINDSTSEILYWAEAW